MRIQLRLAGLLFASIAVVQAHAQSESPIPFDRDRLTATERTWLAAHPVIYQAIFPSTLHPIEFDGPNGSNAGITHDYLEVVEQRLGIRIERLWYDSLPDALEAVVDGHADLIGSIAATPDRARYIDFTDPYLESFNVFVVRSDSRVETESDLRGQRIAIESGFVFEHILASAIADLRFVEVPSTAEALQAVRSGQADAYIGNSLVIRYFLSRPGGEGLRERGELDLPPHYFVFGVRQGALPLVSMINRALASVSAQERHAIRSKWVPDVVEPLHLRRVLAFAWPYLMGIAIAVSVVLVWNQSLRLQIRRRRVAEASARDNQQQLITMTNSLPLAVFQQRIAVSATVRYTFVGEQVVELFGVSGAALMEDPELFWRAIVEEDRLPARQQMLAAQAENLPFRMQFRVNHAAATRWIECASSVTWRANGLSERNGFWLDITALKQAQQTAETATKAKSEFLANMSHEIRTPMNAIVGLSHLMTQSYDAAKQRNHALKLQRSAKSLLSIINDILDFSKIEAGKLEFESVPFDLLEVLDHWVTLLAPQAAEKDLKLAYVTSAELPTALIGDPLRLGQILLNLGSNAVKFTEAGEVMLKVEMLERIAGGLKLRFSVRDTGIGMSEADMERLFIPFEQGDSSISRRFGGTGLGLAISSHLVAALGGQLRACSSRGLGSEFFFESPWRLDVASATGPAPKAKSSVAGAEGPTPISPPKPLAGARLLLVEDNDINRELALELLQGAGARVEVAVDGSQALAVLAEAAFDVVLMDCQMPVMDGYEATRAIRADARWRHLPIIAMTASAMAGDRERALAAGMCDHIEKPIDVNAMFKTLQLWVRL